MAKDDSVGFRCPDNIKTALDGVAKKGDRTRSAQILRYVREGLVRDNAITLTDALACEA